MRIAELPYYLSQAKIEANNLCMSQYMWMVMITMSTVGYGDIYPITVLGKFICFALCLWGMFLMSIVVIILF